ncbi:DUF1573 domain-containing protein [Faecalibacter macacae]|uniref:DUF1573 domain-containing protein n=1 Tax=Faecalibacter macacae TaxID=1859289 RepID=A0A3L9MKK6_9FLAO|nr:DUF1573 domain-containing protein [Faecalibacter macacae]RLZ12716.1 DUF1573 domain-containing protein [Faecalibacter macacae]
MKTKLFILGAVALVMSTTACKEEKATDLYSEQEIAEQASNVVDPATAPVMALTEATHDFGDVKANEKVQAYVKFTNNGKSPLIIQDASATCGCTVPEFPKTPIAVGATDSIKVEYTAGNMNGKQQKTVTLVTNTANGTEQFNISANVVGASEPAQNAQQAFGQ